MLLKQILTFCITVTVIGVTAHVLGEKLPRAKFDYRRFPFRAYGWEKGGRFYQRFGIQRWKDMLPDKSKFVKTTYKKSVGAFRSSSHIMRLIQETCVAETVHWALLAVSPVMLLTMEGLLSVAGALVYGLSNIPFIMIQRYNRPRLGELYERLARQQR